MLSLTLPVLASFLCSLQIAFAVPDPSPTAGQSIPLARRQSVVRTIEDWGVWAKNERESLKVKYGGSTPSKRSEGTNLYFGSLAIGTPATSFYVILDTGSSSVGFTPIHVVVSQPLPHRDLWVADINCDIGCSRESTFNSASSSTFQNLSQPFSVTYGSGQVAGDLVQDVVQMAGFLVKNQVFGAVTQASQGILSNPVSGLLGLAWQSIASSGQPPFWQTLASQGAWSQPVMAFQLTRYALCLISVKNIYSAIISFLNDSSAEPLEPGGSFTMGFLNSSLYTGNIDYQNLVTTPSFWVLSLTKLTVQGSSVSLPSGSASYAAIDTGTTLVGGPSSVIQNIYAQIPDSQPGTVMCP
ncbi:aspartic peptidase domain-containing protein [Lanmaoa asiatica]|nr:aspartic peptidase domain-containing protein [Lanmaoa asiatica]